MKTLKTFWCYYNSNFGDALNRELFRRLGGFDIEYAPVHSARVAGIGSILDKIVGPSPCPDSNGVLSVFSSGFDADLASARRYFQRNLMCYAVRGVKTAKVIHSLSPDAPIGVLGDGGLLLKFLIRDRVQPKYHVGIVPHYVEREDPVFLRLAQGIDGAIILDPREGVEKFLHHLRACRSVVSTALHPLIACDALGIPNRWLRLPGSVLSQFKFEDYYSIYGIDPVPIDPRNCSLDVLSEEAIRAHYAISPDAVAETQERLKDAFGRLCRDLRGSWWRRLFSR